MNERTREDAVRDIESNGGTTGTYYGPVTNSNTTKSQEPQSVSDWVYNHRLDIGIATAIVLSVIAIVLVLKTRTVAQ